MSISTIVTYVDSKDGAVTAQVGPVPYSVGNPPNGWARLQLDRWDANGAYGSATLQLGPDSYAAFIAWLGVDPTQ